MYSPAYVRTCMYVHFLISSNFLASFPLSPWPPSPPTHRQSVPCAGSVEGTITSLLTSLTATLRSQLNTAISSFVCKSESTPSPPSLLSSLPPLWTSQLATQVILLATQLGLDLALTSALRETEKGHRTALESACTELDELVQTAVRMLQGQPAAPEGAEQEQVVQSRPYPPSEREERGRVLVSLEQSNCLQSILLILYSHRQRLQHVEQRGGSSPTESFAWQSRLRWSWSGAERTCHISTVGAGLPYGCHYTGSSGRVVLTPSTERALVFLLQAACQGYSTVLSGREVSGELGMAVHTCIYVRTCMHTCTYMYAYMYVHMHTCMYVCERY